MNKLDAEEAAPIVQRAMRVLISRVPQKGEAGAAARTAISDANANAYSLIRNDSLGPFLANAFSQAQQSGITFDGLEMVRSQLMSENPQTVGGVTTTFVCVNLCLATEGQVIANMTFVSRQDIEAIKIRINAGFQPSEEASADDMDQANYMAMISLHAAIVNHLIVTARPLPKLVQYQFAKVLPSLVLAYRLYGDPSRGDEIRAENKIIHPAFCPLNGIALSR